MYQQIRETPALTVEFPEEAGKGRITRLDTNSFSLSSWNMEFSKDMRVEASLSADERKSLKTGDKVTIELEADATRSYEGTVRYITEMPEEDAEEVTYKAIIDFSPDENVFFGMAVVVTSDAKTASAGTSE